MFPIEVESYSGYKAHQYPLRIKIDEYHLEVKEIIDTWYGPDYLYFKLIASDENRYIIRFDIERSIWSLVEIFISEGSS